MAFQHSDDGLILIGKGFGVGDGEREGEDGFLFRR
jgi:hypothetical protein